MKARVVHRPAVAMGSLGLGLALIGCQTSITPSGSSGGNGADAPETLRVVLNANAGPDQTVNSGDVVALNGSAGPGNAPNGVQFLWTQQSGSPVTISGFEDPVADFTAPAVTSSQVLVFQLVVHIGSNSSSDTVQITVLPATSAPGGDDPIYPTVQFSCDPLDGQRDLSVTCTAATDDGSDLPDGTYGWGFDGQMDSGPMDTHASRTHVFSTGGLRTVTLTLTLAGLTAPISCVSSQTQTTTGTITVWPRISGHVRDAAGAAVPNVAVSANPGGGTSVTGPDGSFSFNVPYRWIGNVTPQSTAYSFDPTDRSYYSLAGDRPADDFVAYAASGGGSSGGGDSGLPPPPPPPPPSGGDSTNPPSGGGEPPPPPPDVTWTISGQVTDASQAPLGGIQVDARLESAATYASAFTDANGMYSFSVPNGWAGSVKPLASTYYFVPASRSFPSVVSNQPGQNFAAVAVSGPTVQGTVRHYDGSVWAGVPVLFSGTGPSAGTDFLVSTNANGVFVQTVSPNWSGMISSDDNYHFDPETMALANVNAPMTGEDVTACRNFYVAINGSDAGQGLLSQPFRSIQKAADVVLPGDTVYVRAGTYHEQISTTRSGTADQRITFKAFPGELVTITGDQTRSYCLIVGQWNTNNNGNYTTVDGFEITGAKEVGVVVFHNINAIVRNIHAHHNGVGTFGYGIQVFGPTTDAVVEYCHVHENMRAGISAVNDDGWLSGRPNNTTVRYCLVYGQSADPENNDGISFYRCDYGEVAYNIVHSNFDDGIDLVRNTHDVHVHHNLVFNQTPVVGTQGDGNGIKNDTSSDLPYGPAGHHVMDHNIVFCNRRSAYDLDISTNQNGNTLYNETYAYNWHAGIGLDTGGRALVPACGSTVKNCLLSGNPDYDYYAGPGYSLAASDHNFVGGVWANQSNPHVTETASLVFWDPATEQGSGSPQFVDPYIKNATTGVIANSQGPLDTSWHGSLDATMDHIRAQAEAAFALQPTSPCRNAGVVIPGVTDGAVGAPDMGAVESPVP